MGKRVQRTRLRPVDAPVSRFLEALTMTLLKLRE
jgi:hypothetical protein